MVLKRKHKKGRDFVDRFIRPEELKIFFAKCFDEKYDLKYKLFFLLALFTGRRISELCAIELRDFSDDFKVLQKVIDCKTGKCISQGFRLPGVVVKILLDWVRQNMARIERCGGYLFPHTNNRHKHMPQRCIWDWLKRKREVMCDECPFLSDVCDWVYYKNPKKVFNKDIKVKKKPIYRWQVHSFRRFFGTAFFDETKDLILTQLAMGHEDAKTTSRYIDKWRLFKEREAQLDVVYENRLCPLVHAHCQKTLSQFV